MNLRDQSDVPGEPPTLEYGPQASAAGIVVNRHGDTMVADAVPTWRRAIRAAAGPVAGGIAIAVLMLAILWFMQLFLRRNRFGGEWTLALLPAPIGLIAG